MRSPSEFAAAPPKTAAELSAPLVREPERTHHDNGQLAAITEYDTAGNPSTIISYGDEPDGDGNPVVTAETHYSGGALHDLNADTPAARTWEDGKPVMRLRYNHGALQDASGGEPAVTAYNSDGGEMLRIHYAGGKAQDPKPGVPAHVATLTGGISWSTFYTQGVVTEQQYKLPSPLSGILPGDIIITNKKAG